MKTFLKYLGAALALVVLALGSFVAWAFASTGRKLATRRSVAPDELKAELAKADLKRGERLVRVRLGCVECHGDDLAGEKVFEDPAAGSVWGANITPAALKGWSDEDYVRAIRHGVSKDGRPLVLMPSHDYQHLGKTDLADIVAYIRSVAPVDKPSKPCTLGPVMKVLVAAGKAAPMVPVDIVAHDAPFPEIPPEGPTAAYGRYLARASCLGCHRESLQGGPIPGGDPKWAPAANLTPDALGGWSEEDFIRTLRTGKNPSGSALRYPMIVKYTARYSDVELKALWAFLKTAKGSEAW